MKVCPKCKSVKLENFTICPKCYLKYETPKVKDERKKMDEAIEVVEQQMLDDAVAKQKMEPILNGQLKKIMQIDNKINWFENKKKELEEEKQLQLRKMDELLDLAMVSTHSLKNGFYVKPDNKNKVEVIDILKFLHWLKANKEPAEVIDFLKTSMKLTSLKSFCQKEFNTQRIAGEIAPSVDGVRFGEQTFRRLTTGIKKK